MSDDAKLITIMEGVMVLAAVKRMDDAKKLMDLNMTPGRFSRWKEETPERGVALALDRLKQKLANCIARYGQ